LYQRTPNAYNDTIGSLQNPTQYYGFEFQYDNNQNALLRKDNQINWTDEERKAFEDEANDSGKAKF
jgi:hypothetical protein